MNRECNTFGPAQCLRRKASRRPLAEKTELTWVPRPLRWTTAWPNWQACSSQESKKDYTNPDVAGVNDATDTIKFRGKVEQVN